jgi:hypothetical protein
MKWLSVLMFSLVLNGAASQTGDIRKWNTVEILCGKLIRSEEIPIKGAPNSFSDKSKPIKNSILRLYLRNEETECCEGQQPVAETVSGREGSFQFKKAAPGAYWIVARVEGKDYKLAITYTPDNKSDTKCSDILYALKKGQLQIERLVTVD